MFHGLVIVDARLLNYNLYNMKKMNNKIRQICIILCLLVVSIILDNIFSFGHVTLAIAPAIIAAGIAAAGSVLGGSMSNSAVKSTNEANAKMASDNNWTQRYMQMIQNEFNEKQWNAANAYNTPLAQRKRYEEAGINPYMALGSVSNGNAQSALTSAPAPNLITPHNEPALGLANGVSAGMSQAANVYATLAEAQKTSAETKGQEIVNKYSSAQMMANIDKMITETHNFKLDSTLKGLQNSLYQDTFKNSLDISDLNVQQARANVEYTISNTKLAKAELDLNIKKGSQVDVQIELARKQYAQDVKESNSRINSNNASASLSYANRLKVILEKNRINYTPEQLKALMAADVDMSNQNINESISRQHLNKSNQVDFKAGPFEFKGMQKRVDNIFNWFK